jgi:hypothetical protein
VTGLPTFFDELHGLVTGRRSAGEVEAVLGASPSGTSRLAGYRTLVRRQRELLLQTFYPATERGLEDFAPGSFLSIARELERAHPPTSGDPNRFAEPLPDVLERAAADGRAPAWAAEVADLELCHYHARFGERPADRRDPGVDRTLFVRRYTHDVLAYLHRALGGACGRVAAPEPAPITIVVCRPLDEDDPFVFHPSVAGLCALAARAGEVVPGGAGPAELVAAERQLVAWRVLAA